MGAYPIRDQPEPTYLRLNPTTIVAMSLQSLEKISHSVKSILGRSLSQNRIAAVATVVAVSFAVYYGKIMNELA
jgi:hypothetical protein